MKKKLEWLFPLLLLFSLFASLTAVHAADEVGYLIKGSVNESAGTFDAAIYAQSAQVVAGRVALGFDPDKLELTDPSSLRAAMTAGNSIRLNTEGLSVGDLVSNDGYVGFCWNPSYMALDAAKQDVLIATVHFRLKPGVTASDFDDDTVRLLRLQENAKWKWSTPAWIMDKSLRDYMYAVPGTSACAVTFDYPNCDVLSPNAREIIFQLRDGTGKPLSGTIQFNGETLTVGADGTVKTAAPRGTYSCLATVSGYESKYQEVTITDHQTVTIDLRADQDVVNAALPQLAIGYADGDSADQVRKDIKLPSQVEACTVTWRSSRPVVVSEYGNVFPVNTDAKIVLTATVEYGTAKAEKSFSITVLGTGSSDFYKNPSTDHTAGIFRDLDGYDWAREAIEALAKAGVISGTTDTTFSPGAALTRGDFMALLMRMLAPEGTPDGTGFTDVPPDSYYYSEITLAKSLGIASGTGNGTFRPGANVSRQDMVTLTYRALLQMGKLSEDAPRADLSRFKDADQISPYARQAMAVMVAAGAISGNTDGTLEPHGNANRAQAAVFLYQIDIHQ